MVRVYFCSEYILDSEFYLNYVLFSEPILRPSRPLRTGRTQLVSLLPAQRNGFHLPIHVFMLKWFIIKRTVQIRVTTQAFPCKFPLSISGAPDKNPKWGCVEVFVIFQMWDIRLYWAAGRGQCLCGGSPIGWNTPGLPNIVQTPTKPLIQIPNPNV